MIYDRRLDGRLGFREQERPGFGLRFPYITKKQQYETDQIKKYFHGADGKADIEKTATETEDVRTSLAAAIAAAKVPVTNVISIKPAS